MSIEDLLGFLLKKIIAGAFFIAGWNMFFGTGKIVGQGVSNADMLLGGLCILFAIVIGFYKDKKHRRIVKR